MANAEAGNEDTWKPTKAGSLASDWHNWSLQKVPGQDASTACFNGNVSNRQIVWDVSLSPHAIILKNGYTGQQILNGGVTVKAAMGITMSAKDHLNVDFKDTKSTLEVDGGTSSLTNFAFSDSNGTFLINGGTVNVAFDGSYKESTRATIQVTGSPANGPAHPEKLGTLNIANQAGLAITGDNTQLIAAAEGVINLDGTAVRPGAASMIMSLGKNQMLLVKLGDLNYTGRFISDTIDIPVLVAGGRATIKEGDLVVKGKLASRGNVAWFMLGGTTALFDGVTLDIANGYTQTGGTLLTFESKESTLAVFPGKINVEGGNIWINPEYVGYVEEGGQYVDMISGIFGYGRIFLTFGKLILEGSQFDMAGTLNLKIDGASKKSDLLEGPWMTRQRTNILPDSELNVTAVGAFPVKGQLTWTILTSRGRADGGATLVEFPCEHLPDGVTSNPVNGTPKNKYTLNWSKQ